MMLLLFLLTLITFSCRYVFLEPKLPIRLNYSAKKFLSYSAPAVLAAIASPIIMMPEAELQLTWRNAYLLAALIAVALMYFTSRMLLTVLVSFASFLLLKTMFN